MLWYAGSCSELPLQAVLQASGPAPLAVWQLSKQLSKARGSTLPAFTLKKEGEPAAPINGQNRKYFCREQCFKIREKNRKPAGKLFTDSGGP